jgi:hypothetical protein
VDASFYVDVVVVDNLKIENNAEYKVEYKVVVGCGPTDSIVLGACCEYIGR